MTFLSKKNQLFAIALMIATMHMGCEKDQIAPFRQDVAFVKYYGHINNQTASDLKRTVDGGYIMCGSTNSYTEEEERDLFVVKTDSLGNEVWNASFGRKGAAVTGGTLDGRFVKYDEEGIDIVVLPEGAGYTIACNRTYVSYPSEFATNGVEHKTKVVLYTLEAGTGANITDISSVVLDPNINNGVELEPFSENTETVSDMKIDTSVTSGGDWAYVLTGQTTRISATKPPDPNGGAFDKTDIFTVKTDQFFNVLWNPLALAYGFVGDDMGTSIQILPDGYLVVGTVEILDPSTASDYIPRLVAVKMKKVNGAPTNPQYFADDFTYKMVGGHSVYDPANRRITIAASVESGTNGNVGHIALLQLNEDLVTQIQNTNNAWGMKFYQPESPPSVIDLGGNVFIAESIAQLPNDAGFVVSMTHIKAKAEQNIAVLKLDEELTVSEGWPYFFGYEDPNSIGTFATKEVAGAIIPVEEAISGIDGVTLTGYAFTGTFGTGTNNMLGLVKLNTRGTLEPE